jgi:hypothetical protein
VAADDTVSTRVRSRLIISPTDDQADEADTTVVAAGPVTPSSDTLSDLGSLERFGQYIVWSDPDTAADTVWTTTGELLGSAVYPDTCTDLIDTHQRRAYGDA